MKMDYSPFNLLRQKVIFEYLDKFPEAGNMTIAKLLFNKYPDFWANLDSCRTVIRYYRGCIGIKSLNELKDKKYVRKQV